MGELRLPELRAGRFWRVTKAVSKEGMVLVSLMQEDLVGRGDLVVQTLRSAYAEASAERMETVARGLRAAQDKVDQVNAVVATLVGDYRPKRTEGE